MVRFYRKVIHVCAEDSPNVKLAYAEMAEGKTPSGRIVVPGVLPWSDYLKRRQMWDPVRQCIGLDGKFYEGKEVLLFPPDWLDRAEAYADRMAGKPRQAKAIGCDPGEGVSDSSIAVVDEYGLIEVKSLKTPDTTVIVDILKSYIERYKVPHNGVMIDRGGGGKQHADRLRKKGYKVRTVAFGETLVPDPRKVPKAVSTTIDEREERYTYFNRRSQMYGELRLLLDPCRDVYTLPLPNKDKGVLEGFTLPREYSELRRQLAPIPLTYDPEGRLRLIPKNKTNPDSKQKTLVELIGCSPDQADALVLAVFGMLHPFHKPWVGAPPK